MTQNRLNASCTNHNAVAELLTIRGDLLEMAERINRVLNITPATFEDVQQAAAELPQDRVDSILRDIGADGLADLCQQEREAFLVKAGFHR